VATLLSVLQDACDFGGFPRPTSIINNTDATTRQLLAIANERGIEAVRMFDWPQLTKLSSLSLVAGTNQTLPADCAELLDSTAWYTGDMTPIRGPITPREWQALTQTGTAGIKFAFRVSQNSKGARAVAMHPTPVGNETISLFYRSKTWIKPREWAASMSVTAGMWVFSDGEYWTANTSGTAGTSAPTIANNGADGTITWTRKANVLYERFIADTDEPLIEPSILMKGILARFYRMKGLEYQDLEAEFNIGLRNDLAERNGGRTSNIFRYNCGFLDTGCRDVGFIGGVSSTPVTPVVPTVPVYPGVLFGFGSNSVNQLAGSTDFLYPTNTISGSNWIDIECEGYPNLHSTLAIKSDGTLWGWGSNNFGQLGDGTTTQRSQPTQAGTATDWAKVSSGLYYSAGIKSNGTMWIWGGDNNNVFMIPGGAQSLIPLQVGTDTNWKEVFCTNFFTLALKTDDTLWGWGGNSYGWLGQGNQTSSATPIQIPGTWLSVAATNGGSYGGHALGIKADGTLWGWGDGSAGQITTGSPGGVFSSPTQIGTANNWAKVACSTHISHAIKTDGTLWSWGNTIGAISAAALGLGGTTSSTTPLQVGSATNWASFSKVGAYTEMRHALKTNGELWGWGSTQGYIGNGTQGANSPVLISSLPNIRKVSTGSTHAMFIQG
jgi:alpha-tubulin suppressor-like RCC1 family protein